MGLPRDHTKAMKLWLQTGKLGSSMAYYAIGKTYLEGDGEEVSIEKTLYYYQLTAIGGNVGGNVGGRVNLGFMAKKTGDMKKAVKHYMISAACGENFSLGQIRELYMEGHTPKYDLQNALRTHRDTISR